MLDNHVNLLQLNSKLSTITINNTNITLVLGNPLAGKTRIVFDTLNTFKSGVVIFPQPSSTIKEYHLPHRDDIILFIDELDTFCEKNKDSINKLIHYAILQDYKCVFTCRTGPELTKVKETLNHQLWTELIRNRINIKKISKDDLAFNESPVLLYAYALIPYNLAYGEGLVPIHSSAFLTASANKPCA